jgi:hypothetical protein
MAHQQQSPHFHFGQWDRVCCVTHARIFDYRDYEALIRFRQRLNWASSSGTTRKKKRELGGQSVWVDFNWHMSSDQWITNP